MPNYRALVVLHTADNNAANFVTNTFHFNADDNSVLPTIAGALEAFYDDVRPELSNLLAQNDHDIKFYDMADPEPRAPVLEVQWDFASAIASAPLPPEVCLCLSFQGVKVSGIPQARRRGRVFIGPIAVGSVGTDGRPDAGCVTNLNLAGDALLASSEAATDWRWQIYSRVDDGFIDVENGWVDNEFDTQRSRGRVYTNRSTFT